MNTKRFILFSLCIIVLLATGYCIREKRFVSDDDFVLLKDIVSPDRTHRILTYQHDAGALGYSGGWTAVTPLEYKDLNLANYELPDCYDAGEWTNNSELIVLKEEPCRSGKDSNILKTDDIFRGVEIQVVDRSKFLEKKGLKEASTALK